MSTTVLEALMNARCNFETLGKRGLGGNPIYMIAFEQLNNGITALENGKAPTDIIQENIADDVNVGEPPR